MNISKRWLDVHVLTPSAASVYVTMLCVHDLQVNYTGMMFTYETNLASSMDRDDVVMCNISNGV